MYRIFTNSNLPNDAFTPIFKSGSNMILIESKGFETADEAKDFIRSNPNRFKGTYFILFVETITIN